MRCKSAVSSAELCEAARRWLGVPFRHQGRDRRGVDCVGLIIVACRELGLPAGSVKLRDYGRLPCNGLLELQLAEHALAAPAPEPGTILLMRFGRWPQHVALCTGSTLVHSYEAVGKVVEHGYSGKWPGRTVSAWRVPGVVYG